MNSCSSVSSMIVFWVSDDSPFVKWNDTWFPSLTYSNCHQYQSPSSNCVLINNTTFQFDHTNHLLFFIDVLSMTMVQLVLFSCQGRIVSCSLAVWLCACIWWESAFHVIWCYMLPPLSVILLYNINRTEFVCYCSTIKSNLTLNCRSNHPLTSTLIHGFLLTSRPYSRALYISSSCADCAAWYHAAIISFRTAN